MEKTKPKSGISKQGKPMHYSVGAIIKKGNKYLLIDRVKPPYGFAALAGHIDEGENAEQALLREVREESGLKVLSYELLCEEELDWNWCSKGIGAHYWYLYKCEVEGDINQNKAETKSIGWFSESEIKKLKLEPVWKHWFKKLNIFGNKMNKIINKVSNGINQFNKRTLKQKEIFKKVINLASKDKSKFPVFFIREPKLFKEVIENFGPILNSKKAKSNLSKIYEIGLHKETGALIISNRGATLYCLSPKTETPYLVKHVGFCVYMPGIGIEFVNVGLVGNVYSGKVVLRSESACTPSFLFGSQRCNCSHQWDSINELAAYFHKINPPKIKNGKEFEAWVQKQSNYSNGKHLFLKNKTPGFILMHLDTQNGMGSGYTKNEFSYDLFSRASMRHRGEYSAEQIDKTSMWGGFGAIGLTPDPRREEEYLGYKLTFVILDFLKTSKDTIFLTNNPFKMEHLENNGYNLARLKSLGMINLAGAQEAIERHDEFHHLDINGKCISFKKELNRLKKEIRRLTK